MNRNTNESSVSIYTRLPLDEADRLEKVAIAADRTVAAEVRRAVREYLANQGTNQGVSAAG